ncbi:hypothetical protein [Nocardia sp. NPDC047648]|uniref:hypothetical protein n=1 Tax=Nocardia sp. NPDC047648 TaxID=3155625 RepID=UPI0033D6DA79
MGGVDASAGFAYQHAQAVQMALTIATDPSLHAIRVEVMALEKNPQTCSPNVPRRSRV